MDLVTVDIFCFYYFGAKVGLWLNLAKGNGGVSSNPRSGNSALIMRKMANASLP
jgi:hypothetical protein